MIYSHLFAFKRVYQTTQLHLTRALARYGLSPARLEVLRQLLHLGGLPQDELRARLGVARSTLSRMLTAMQARGLVERVRSRSLPRQKLVSIAPDLRRAVAHVLAALAPALMLAARVVLAPGHRTREWFDHLFRLEVALSDARARLADRATTWATPMLDRYEH